MNSRAEVMDLSLWVGDPESSSQLVSTSPDTVSLMSGKQEVEGTESIRASGEKAVTSVTGSGSALVLLNALNSAKAGDSIKLASLELEDDRPSEEPLTELTDSSPDRFFGLAPVVRRSSVPVSSIERRKMELGRKLMVFLGLEQQEDVLISKTLFRKRKSGAKGDASRAPSLRSSAWAPVTRQWIAGKPQTQLSFERDYRPLTLSSKIVLSGRAEYSLMKKEASRGAPENVNCSEILAMTFSSLYAKNAETLASFYSALVENNLRGSSDAKAIAFVSKLVNIVHGSRSELNGVRVAFKGRNSRWARTKKQVTGRGGIPQFAYTAPVSYGRAQVVTAKGAIDLRVWVYFRAGAASEKGENLSSAIRAQQKRGRVTSLSSAIDF